MIRLLLFIFLLCIAIGCGTEKSNLDSSENVFSRYQTESMHPFRADIQRAFHYNIYQDSFLESNFNPIATGWSHFHEQSFGKVQRNLVYNDDIHPNYLILKDNLLLSIFRI